MSLDPRPAPRIKDHALLTVLKWEYDECEFTGETERLHLHHVIFKSQGGDDLRQNIVCMVEHLHTDYHAGRAEARRMLASHVRTIRLDVAEYIEKKLGGPSALAVWFERHGLA